MISWALTNGGLLVVSQWTHQSHWWNRGQPGNVIHMHSGFLQIKCAFRHKRQVFNFLLLDVVGVHLTDRFRCHMLALRNLHRDIKLLVKVLQSYIHPPTAIKRNILLVFHFASEKLSVCRALSNNARCFSRQEHFFFFFSRPMFLQQFNPRLTCWFGPKYFQFASVNSIKY